MSSAVMKEMPEKKTVKFGDICREVKLTTKDPLADGYDRYIGLEHLDSGSLNIKRWGSVAEDNPSFTRVFKKGQILFGKRRPYLKKAAIAEFDGICSGDIIVMEPKGDLMLPELLPFIVQSDKFWDWAIKTSSGSLSPRTKYSALKEFALDGYDELKQKNLRKTLHLMRAAINLNDECVLTINDLIEIVLRNELFSFEQKRLFDADRSPVKSGVVDCALGDILSSIVDCEHKTVNYTKGKTEFAVVRTNNVKSGRFVLEDLRFTDEKGYREWTKRKEPEVGDILFTREAPAGESCLVPDDFHVCMGQRMVLLEPNRKLVNPKFLSRYLASKFARHYIERYIVGTTVERINISDIPRIRFLMPTIQRQNKIVETIELIEGSYFLLTRKSVCLPKIIEGML